MNNKTVEVKIQVVLDYLGDSKDIELTATIEMFDATSVFDVVATLVCSLRIAYLDDMFDAYYYDYEGDRVFVQNELAPCDLAFGYESQITEIIEQAHDLLDAKRVML